MNMPLFDDFVQMSDATPLPSPHVVHVPMVPSQHTPMQSMDFMEVFSPNNLNTPLVQIIILELDAQQTLINTLDMQVDPFINPPKIIVDDKLGILH
jgi:hypothetical protein